MDFQEKHELIKQTVWRYTDKYGMFTADDLVSEAWLNKQVRESDKPAHVVKATKDACVNFLGRWYKTTGINRKKCEIKIAPMSVLLEDERARIGGCEQDSATELLKEDLCKQMSKEERRIVEYRLQGRTYKEIAVKMRKSETTVKRIHQKMKKRMCEMKDQLLGD